MLSHISRIIQLLYVFAIKSNDVSLNFPAAVVYVVRNFSLKLEIY